MPGLGTAINAGCIILGGLVGLAFGSRFKENLQEIMLEAVGLAVMFMGIGTTISKMLVLENGEFQVIGTMMMTISLSLGALIGEILKIQDRIESFGKWLQKKTGNAKDPQFVDAFMTATLTVCIGAMAVIGSIEDGVNGNYSILAAKGLADLVIVLIMTASLGKGCIFSAIPVIIVQGLMTAAAHFVAPYLTDAAMDNLSLVGSILIFVVGINLIRDKKIRVANMLPALVIAVVFAYIHI